MPYSCQKNLQLITIICLAINASPVLASNQACLKHYQGNHIEEIISRVNTDGTIESPPVGESALNTAREMAQGVFGAIKGAKGFLSSNSLRELMQQGSAEVSRGAKTVAEALPNIKTTRSRPWRSNCSLY